MGLGLEHTRADVARAVSEGAGHAVAEAILAYGRAGVSIDRVVAIGGATKNDVITGTVSTVTGLTQEVVVSPGAAYGDAFLAALGIGAIADPSAGSTWWQTGRTVAPDAEHAAVLQADHKAFVDLYRALAPWNRARAFDAQERPL